MKKYQPSNCINCKALQPNMRCSLGFNNCKIPKGISPLQFQFSGTTFFGYPQEFCPKPLTDQDLKSLKGETK